MKLSAKALIVMVAWAGVALFSSGCAGRKYDRLSIVWTSPSVKPAKEVQVVQDADLIKNIAKCMPGFDDPSQRGAPADPPMYDLRVEFQDSTGKKVVVKIYLPRVPAWAGMWKHPTGGQLNYFGEKEGPELVELLRPYLPEKI